MSSELSPKLDALDIKIVKELLKNSRKPIAEIASNCKVSNLTINKRINELKKSGVILGSSVLIDYAHFGAECLGILSVNVNPNQSKEFIKDMQSMEGNFFSMEQKFLEKSNVLIVSLVKSFRELNKISESVKRHPAVIDAKMNIWTYMKVDTSNLKLEKF